MAHILGGTEDDPSAEPWWFNLFTKKYRALSCVLVGVLYPFFFIWVIVGTLWYAELNENNSCITDQQQSWYFVLWIIIFYMWLIGYTTAILISLMIYFRNRTFHNQYVRLREQYGDESPPEPNFTIQGLSPYTIQGFAVQEIATPDQNQFTCSVCQDELAYHERARVLSCGHKFHLACIDRWLMRQSWCPNCKRNLRRDQRHQNYINF